MWVQVSVDGGEIVEKFVVQQFIWPRARMVAMLVWVGLGFGLEPQRIAMAISPVWCRPGALSVLRSWAASVLAPIPLSLAFEASLPSFGLLDTRPSSSRALVGRARGASLVTKRERTSPPWTAMHSAARD